MDKMNAIFNTIFDDPKPALLLSDDGLPMIYTSDDLENSRLMGKAQGHARGLEEGFIQGEMKAANDQILQIQAILHKISDDVLYLLNNERIYNEKLSEAVIEITLAIVKKLMPHYMEKEGLNEVEHAIRTILSTLIDQQNVTLYLNSEYLSEIDGRLTDIKQRTDNRVTIMPDNDLSPWECRTEWFGGGARWSQDNLIDKIKDIFTHFIHSLSKEDSHD